MIVRCTAKLRALLGRQAQPPSDPVVSPDDFYANLLIIERRKCLLVTHAATLFSVFCPDVRAAQLRPLGPFLVWRIVAQLDAEGLSERALGELDGGQVTIAATAGGRSVLGCMHDLALTCRWPQRTPAAWACWTSQRFTTSCSATSTPPAATCPRSTSSPIRRRRLAVSPEAWAAG